MARYEPDDNGVERCERRPKIHLTREEVAFCLAECNLPLKTEDYAGGTKTDDYLSGLLRKALEAAMREKQRTELVEVAGARIILESMKIIAYARASDEAQQITLRDQQEKLRQYAALYDHAIVEMVVGTESAKTIDKREEFQRVLQMLRDDRADGLLVLKLDRLARDVGDGAHLLKTYFGEGAKYRKHLLSVMDYLDTRTPNGRMIFNMLLTIAQWERETIAARTKAALAFKISRGERVGAVKFGYQLGDDGRTLVENAREQEGLRFMRQLAAQGSTLREIANAMQDAGFQTKSGKPWSHGTVKQILRREQDAA